MTRGPRNAQTAPSAESYARRIRPDALRGPLPLYNAVKRASRPRQALMAPTSGRDCPARPDASAAWSTLSSLPRMMDLPGPGAAQCVNGSLNRTLSPAVFSKQHCAAPHVSTSGKR